MNFENYGEFVFILEKMSFSASGKKSVRHFSFFLDMRKFIQEIQKFCKISLLTCGRTRAHVDELNSEWHLRLEFTSNPRVLWYQSILLTKLMSDNSLWTEGKINFPPPISTQFADNDFPCWLSVILIEFTNFKSLIFERFIWVVVYCVI